MKEKFYPTSTLYIGYVNLNEYKTIFTKKIYTHSLFSCQIFSITRTNGQVTITDLSTTFYPQLTAKYYQNIRNLNIESFIPISYFLEDYEQQEIFIPASRLKELYLSLNPTIKEKLNIQSPHKPTSNVLKLTDYKHKKQERK